MALFMDDGSSYESHFDYHQQLAQNDKQTQTQETQKTVSDVLDRYGVSSAFKQGIYYNINAESSWNPTSSHFDQPRFTGEASKSHGLFQEGGAETMPLLNYAASKGKQWTDPGIQTEFAMENLKSRGLLDKYKGMSDWRDVAAGFATDYLRPRKDILQDRVSNIYGKDHYPGFENAVTDRSHHVPLIAGALMDNNGRVYGTAMDERVPHVMNLFDDSGKPPITIDSAKFVHAHEMAEVKDMEQLIHGNGVRSGEAYTQSHNKVATPHEQAAVKKFASAQGRDPDQVWRNYEAFWAQQLPHVSHEPMKVHPDLYLHPYDGHKYQNKMEQLTGRKISNHPKDYRLAEADAVEKKRQEEMDKLGTGLKKDLNPFGGLLDLMEEDEQQHKKTG